MIGSSYGPYSIIITEESFGRKLVDKDRETICGELKLQGRRYLVSGVDWEGNKDGQLSRKLHWCVGALWVPQVEEWMLQSQAGR